MFVAGFVLLVHCRWWKCEENIYRDKNDDVAFVFYHTQSSKVWFTKTSGRDHVY